jgi:dCMP deaminase
MENNVEIREFLKNKIECKLHIGFGEVFIEHMFNNSVKSIHINELNRDKLKQIRLDLIYLRMAKEWSKNSYCIRKKVGSLIVNNNKIISDGYNGMPYGFNNKCEDDNGKTKWNVLHAEANALMKLTKSSDTAYGATMYLTFSPCENCSKLIHQAGIKRLVFTDLHSNLKGLMFLNEAGVDIWRYTNIYFDNFDLLNSMINQR